MFVNCPSNNSNTLPQNYQDANEKNFKKNLHLLKETETGYKLLCGKGSLQKNQRQFAIVYLQTPEGGVYPQERVCLSELKTRKGSLYFIYDLPDGFGRLENEELEQIKEQIVEILQGTKDEPVCLGADESPQGVYELVIDGIEYCSENIENNPHAKVFIKGSVGYIRTTHFREFLKKLDTGYSRKEVLGLLKLMGKLKVDNARAYDKRLHFGEVDGKFYAVKLPEDAGEKTEENVKILLPLLDENTSESMPVREKDENAKLTLFEYYGGKNRISDKLNDLMPESKIYIEPFVGSGATLLNRARSGMEIINDFDSAISNFYKVLADGETGKELLEKIYRLPYDEKLFDMAHEHQGNNFYKVSDFDKALLTFVLVTQSYNSARRQFSRGDCQTGSYQRKIRSNLPKVYERLQGVQVQNRNALDIITDMKDNPDVQMYLDPPYLHSLRGEGADKAYFKEMEYIDHVRMLETIRDAKCRILLSGYHAGKNDLYDAYLLPHGWKSQELTKVIKSSQRQKERDIASEWVWLNYDT